MGSVRMTDKNIQLKDSKYVLITYLLEVKKISLPKIIKLSPQDAAEQFDKSMDETIAECLKYYVNKNIDAIKSSKFFFPGKDGSESKMGSILSGLRLYLIKNGRSLKELGLSSRRAPEDGIPEDADSPEEVAKALKNLFK
jgi:hypothetical protein